MVNILCCGRSMVGHRKLFFPFRPLSMFLRFGHVVYSLYTCTGVHLFCKMSPLVIMQHRSVVLCFPPSLPPLSPLFRRSFLFQYLLAYCLYYCLTVLICHNPNFFVVKCPQFFVSCMSVCRSHMFDHVSAMMTS